MVEGVEDSDPNQRIDSHDQPTTSTSDSTVVPTPDSPVVTTTDLPPEPVERPSTPERVSPSEPDDQQQTPTSSSPTQSASPTSSPSTSTTPSGGGGGSNAPPSRRVKVYKLKDDAWVDLGTGTCRGVLNHSQSPPGDMEDLGKKREAVDPAKEGAWIVVKREKPTKSSSSISPTKTGTGEQQEEESESEEDDEEDDDEKNVILRTRVQPYPPGYSEDFEEEEELLESSEEGGQTLDVGGYQRQQDTLIVWTERPDGTNGGEEGEMEMALSFATSTGCAEMWEFIKAARRFTAEQAMLLSSSSPSPSLSSPRSFPMHANFTPASTLSSQLPAPTLGSIPQLEGTIRYLSKTAVSRERLAIQIIKTGFIEGLIKVHEEAEDLESLEDLHALCRVMQTILLLNDNSIFELVLKDELILGVAGILEYDPDFPTMKASYKSHLSSPTSFISLVPISSPSLLSKIHQTHRLHYLKDVILARILEDSTFSLLNSAIYFNEVEIVNEVVGTGNTTGGNGAEGQREKEGLVKKVFGILTDEEEGEGGKGKGKELGRKRTEIGPELPPDLLDSSDTRVSKKPKLDNASVEEDSKESKSLRKQHSIQFLSQLSLMAKNLQLPLRTSLYRTLVEKGLLSALERALRFANELKDVGLRSQVVGIWMSVVDLDAKDVRAYCLKQGKESEKENENEEMGEGEGKEKKDKKLMEETMLGGLIETLKEEEDLGIKTHLAEALRVLLDAAGESGPLEAPPRLRAPEDPEAEKFLQYFYDHYILSLLQPLIELPERKETDPPLDLSPSRTALLSHLCDLLCFFISHHSFRSKYLILSSPLLSRSISNLLRPKPRLTRHTHLRLACLRFFRSCVARNDDFYNRFLIKHDLVKCVVETMEKEGNRDNLLASACLEFFEYIRGTNAKGLINHLMDRSGEQIKRLSKKFKTFEGLVSRWAINNEPPPSSTTLNVTMSEGGGKEGEGGNGENGTKGAMSEAMTRQTSKPGWPSSTSSSSSSTNNNKMDLEEESYFNTDDDDDDPIVDPKSDPPSGDSPSKLSNSDNDSTTIKNEESSPTTSTTSNHFASSRRKREPTSNPSLSSTLNESKRVRLDDEVEENEDGEGGRKVGGLPRSQTWPQGARAGGGLVDYMDEDEVDDSKELEGGFIREEKGKNGSTSPKSKSKENAKSPSLTTSAPLPLPGALKRKQEEEEESEGLGGLLLKSKTIKKEKESSSSPKTKPSPTSTTTTKPGGFKISFGSSLTSSKSAPASTPLNTKKEEEEEEGDKKKEGGFGKFGSGSGSGSTEPSSTSTEKG
ncbi:Psy2p [Sporobolomyces salmoneus]|uniref:Psy2p n=1 Tax=Sporobolomyces salmoneus TaxID=183962 RepID=UPI0031776F8B